MADAEGARDWPPRNVLITGAASGIGRELAMQLQKLGSAIAGIDLNAAGLQSLNTPHYVADVTDAVALRNAVEELEKQVGAFDLVIASAGLGYETSVLKFDAEAFAAIISVNLIGVANTIAAVVPGMLQRSGGRLAALSSLASYRGIPRMAAYCASKSGVNAMMEAFRVELAPKQISATTICPGWIRTPMTDSIGKHLPNLLEVPAACTIMLDAIRRRKAHAVFPRQTANQVRLLRWLPAGMSDWLVARHVRGS